jgi:hypothetical protein
MNVSLNSFSSSLMLGATLYRNRPGFSNKLIAQVGYALIAVVSAIETAAALAFSALSLVVYPFSSTPFDHSAKWLDSSVFSLGWSAVDFALNLFVSPLIADEKSVRQILVSGDLMWIPPGAVFF